MPPSARTEQVIRNWCREVERLKRTKSELTEARCAVNNAANNLGRMLVPSDANEGEVFCIWVNHDGTDRMLEIIVNRRNDFDVHWRSGHTLVAAAIRSAEAEEAQE